MVVIHGRWTGWLRDFGTAIGGVVGGLSLLMTYYGVNFFLSGLHSYAGASTDTVSFPGWLVGWLAFEGAAARGLDRASPDGRARRGSRRKPLPSHPLASGLRESASPAESVTSTRQQRIHPLQSRRVRCRLRCARSA